MAAAVKGSKRKDGIWISEPVIAEAFTFHDLRAKRASDAEDVAEANEALGHDDLKTTQKVDRRIGAGLARGKGRRENIRRLSGY
jgi:integrase